MFPRLDDCRLTYILDIHGGGQYNCIIKRKEDNEMEIIDKYADSYCHFEDLDIGDTFYCDGRYYLKTEPGYVDGINCNAIILSGEKCGRLCLFRDVEWVIKRMGKVIFD